MDLNTQALEGLQILGDSTLIPDKAFGTLIENCFDQALGLSSGPEHSGVSGSDSGLTKQCTFGLLTAIYEGAKVNTDQSNLSSVLEECKWTPERVEFLLKKFEECKDEIRAELSRIGVSYPHIVDVDWRLDYYVKNNHLDKINEPSYLVSLKTQIYLKIVSAVLGVGQMTLCLLTPRAETGEQRCSNVQFSCSVEELQDLVGKLKDATKSLERASQS